jgi:uncharacterized protein (TIGR02145 family)
MKTIKSHLASFSFLIPGLFLLFICSCKKESSKDLATVTVATMSNITKTTATSGGEVTSNGGAEVTARGVCWSTNANPTTADKKTNDGSGTGSFTSSITGLNAGGVYNVRAYAINSVGTAYSAQVTFNALSSVPVLTTTSLAAVTTTSATSGGNISDDGGASVTARGVCWKTSSNPTIENNKTTDGTGAGAFSSSIAGLTANTTYYIRAYATNSIGTSYGDEILFKTYTGTVTDINTNIYSTVTIGSQVWMAENLKTTKYNDGTSVPLVAEQAKWNALTAPGFCWYNNDEATYKATYGALYNWYSLDAASNGGKNICPTGWHVPTEKEWEALETFLNGEVGAGGKLKEAGLVHWLSPNTGATNETGFTALPAGSRGSTYMGITNDANFWTSTEYNSGSSMNRFISCSNSNVHILFSGKQNGFSIRCLKN